MNSTYEDQTRVVEESVSALPDKVEPRARVRGAQFGHCVGKRCFDRNRRSLSVEKLVGAELFLHRHTHTDSYTATDRQTERDRPPSPITGDETPTDASIQRMSLPRRQVA